MAGRDLIHKDLFYLEDYQGEIYYHYIVKRRTQKDVLSILKEQHGVDVSKKQLTTALSKWEYTRYTKAREISSIAQGNETLRRENSSLQPSLPLSSGYLQRGNAGVGNPSQPSYSGSQQILSHAPPRFLREEQWRGCETVFFHIDKLIQGSFEAGHWRWSGQETIINSSIRQQQETVILHSFLNSVQCAHLSIDRHDLTQAVLHWDAAFQAVDHLVQGQYHDIIPNLVQKINDINDKGQVQVALELLRHITECAQTYLKDKPATYPIYASLADIPMVHLPALEARIMGRFREFFEWYQGPRSYNTSVMMVNQARRWLMRDDNARLEDVLPPVDHYDQIFGVCNRRSLDIIALRLEITYKRRQFVQLETEATILIQRAKLIRDDDWHRLYNLVRGWYHLGCAQFSLLKWVPAMTSFDRALQSDAQLRELGNWTIFDTEKVAIEGFRTQMFSFPAHEGFRTKSLALTI
ncbi:hypothetical protein FCIRC_7640 [Fusarium circinatum]|uniref:Clr5 domain-containing protein n=1 Tax=Fusarium circinatum TaxID=48490 RepID=A0A8H5TSM7_FUSCI|nr:hypothetical protein FCIRC_7640 [Fusarium circinatum]